MANKSEAKVHTIKSGEQDNLCDIVAEATRTARQIKELTAKLEGQKQVIRDRSKTVKEEMSADRIEIESTEGIAVVAFADDTIDFLDPMRFTPGDLKKELPTVVWKALFIEKIGINRDQVKAVLPTLTKAQKLWVDGVLTTKPLAPSVTLPK